MKKYFFFAVLTMMACTESDETVVAPVQSYIGSNKPTQEALSGATRQLEDVFTDIYQNAYDETDGYLDPIAFEGIAAQRLGISLPQLQDLENQSESAESQMTDAQKDVFAKIKARLRGKCGISDDDVAYAESLCSNLSQQEGEQIMLIVFGAQCASRAINKIIFAVDRTAVTRATLSGETQQNFEIVTEFRVRTFACNVAAGVIGTVAGQITTIAIVSGNSGPAGWAIGAGIVVSWGVAALVSTVYC